MPAKLIDSNTIVCWLRRDLRLEDQAALYYALKGGAPVVPLFIFDTTILQDLEDEDDARVTFLHQTIKELQAQLAQHGSSLVVLHGDPVALFDTLTPRAVYTNHDYEPQAIKRDQAVARLLKKKGIDFKQYKDQVIFDTDEVLKDDGTPYTVFTPYSKKWKATLTPFYTRSYPTHKYLKHLKPMASQALPSLQKLGFTKSEVSFPPRMIRQAIIKTYHKTRDYPSIEGTSRLSVHLRFGTVSIRKLVQVALQKNEVWLNELIWREFYMMILWHFPHVVTQSFKPVYDRISWRNDPDEFAAWCEGRTGYPIVDAGMRQLNTTGYMHNRVRMITASFLVKHLLIDWRWGEAYFGRKLLDYDLAANNGGWQWAAGCGCDAAPYFRIFNPALQTEKFDQEHQYIRTWVPEYDTYDYPDPIVPHPYARARVLKAYEVIRE